MTAAKQWSTRTADGRDLSKATFRPIPGFSRYRITADGDVQNRNTGRILRESETSKGSWAYTLWRDGGGKTSRNYVGLVAAAWGDTTTMNGEKE